MPPGKSKGCPKTGGRKAGTLNRATVLKREALADVYSRMGITQEQLAEITPLQAMLIRMHKALDQQNYDVVRSPRPQPHPSCMRVWPPPS